MTDPKTLGALLRAIDGFDGQPTTHAALKLMALLFPRPGELRAAEWPEFDLEKAVWIIPALRMKMRRAHRVPLPKQAIAVLRELKETTGETLVFPSVRSATRPISDGTLNAALRRLGYSKNEATAHGLRATASSLLNECGKPCTPALNDWPCARHREHDARLVQFIQCHRHVPASISAPEATGPLTLRS